MTSPILLGIDVGTSSTKSLVLSSDGRVLGVAVKDTPVNTPRPGWAEQDPEGWVAAALSTARRAVDAAGVDASAIHAVGLSGQMHGTVCVDSSGVPLRPAVIWADQRSSQQVAEVQAEIGPQRLAAWTGNPVATGFMLATWLWLRALEPGVYKATHWLLLPKDYVRYRITGCAGTEPSDAASTSLFDLTYRTWSTPLMAALGLDAAVLPAVHASTEVAGGLTREAASAAGLVAGTPVVYGGSDQAAQALGNGVLTPGVASSTIGTGGQIFAPTARPTIDVAELRMHSYCHVLPDVWHVQTAILSAGLSLRWLRDQVLGEGSYQELADMASTVPAGASGLLFSPYLAGERTPHMDPRARASFVGLTRRHERRHLVRAVMEGVVLAMRQGLDVMEALGVPLDTIVASGGAAKHPLWLQLQADIFDRPVTRTDTIEAAATGAAMLAGAGVGAFASLYDAVDRVVRYRDGVVRPDASRVAAYKRVYELYGSLYPALRSTGWALTEVAMGEGDRAKGCADAKV